MDIHHLLWPQPHPNIRNSCSRKEITGIQLKQQKIMKQQKITTLTIPKITTLMTPESPARQRRQHPPRPSEPLFPQIISYGNKTQQSTKENNDINNNNNNNNTHDPSMQIQRNLRVLKEQNDRMKNMIEKQRQDEQQHQQFMIASQNQLEQIMQQLNGPFNFNNFNHFADKSNISNNTTPGHIPAAPQPTTSPITAITTATTVPSMKIAPHSSNSTIHNCTITATPAGKTSIATIPDTQHLLSSISPLFQPTMLSHPCTHRTPHRSPPF